MTPCKSPSKPLLIEPNPSVSALRCHFPTAVRICEDHHLCCLSTSDEMTRWSIPSSNRGLLLGALTMWLVRARDSGWVMRLTLGGMTKTMVEVDFGVSKCLVQVGHEGDCWWLAHSSLWIVMTLFYLEGNLHEVDGKRGQQWVFIDDSRTTAPLFGLW